jgi:hypothetical protein
MSYSGDYTIKKCDMSDIVSSFGFGFFFCSLFLFLFLFVFLFSFRAYFSGALFAPQTKFDAENLLREAVKKIGLEKLKVCCRRIRVSLMLFLFSPRPSSGSCKRTQSSI